MRQNWINIKVFFLTDQFEQKSVNDADTPIMTQKVMNGPLAMALVFNSRHISLIWKGHRYDPSDSFLSRTCHSYSK